MRNRGDCGIGKRAGGRTGCWRIGDWIARAAAALLLLAGACGPQAVLAQTSPAFRNLDANGVDVITGDLVLDVPEASIGSGDAKLSLTRQNNQFAPTQWDGYYFILTRSGTTTTIRIGLADRTGDTFVNGVSNKSDGATLTGGSNSYTYRHPDGTSVTFTDQNAPGGSDGVITNFCGSEGTALSCELLPTTITAPGGRTVTLMFGRYSYPGVPQGTTPTTVYGKRLWTITNSYGYQIKFAYVGSGLFPHGSGSAPPPASWLTRISAKFYNTAVSTSVPQSTVSYATPSTGVTEVTDPSGEVTTVTAGSVQQPGDTTPSLDTTSSGGSVTSATKDGVTRSYAETVVGGIRKTTITDPDGKTRVIVHATGVDRPASVTDENGDTVSYAYDTKGRMTRKTFPEGNYINYTYDSRGNITETRLVAKPGSGLADIVSTAAFPATCTNPLTCNKPTSVTDPLGKVTSYVYDPTHGGVTSVTGPAVGGVSPQIRYSYTQVAGAYKVTGISQCRTTASCAGTADEVKTVMAYDTNGNMTSITDAAGNGSVSATSTMSYDARGNMLTIDGPLPGSADTVTYRYNANNRLVGVIAPDPDGAGPRLRSAIRYRYAPRGAVVGTDYGTVAGTSDIDWAAFALSYQQNVTYDSNHRPSVSKLVSGSTTYGVTQYSYDALGRLGCAAVRMNPAVFASLPASACTAGTTGSAGPDRITRTSYDDAGQVTKVETAVGTAEAANAVTSAYTANGQLSYVIDGENNRTTYIYDGFDRLSQTRYPVTTKGANSSNASDYEQLSYDARSSVTQRRLRDGTSIGYTYDALGRVTAKDLPGTEPDTSYSYDLLGRATGAVQGTQTLSFVQDALGRLTSQTGPLGTTGYTYDAAGQRLTMSYPGGVLTLNYDYDAAGNITKIRENGASSGVGVLAAYAYDDLGRLTSVTYGNGSVQSFAYDAASRLSTLTNNLGGAATTHDLTQTFTYNPADQIASVTRSNDAYAWQAHYNVDRSYTINGLNRIMNVGSTAFTYDGRGNLTNDGTNAFTYTSENLLKTGPSTTLAYDPLGRLYETVKSPTTTRFLYDGADLIGEYNGSNAVQRRYVHGPGVDEPIVWYEGGTVSNTTRRFLMRDERGSVVSITDSSGATIHINAYDEYGIPAPGNIGRFGYTGQTWLPELGMWYYKARLYSPTLGRFLQTDPIGYSDGMNWYNYVGSDPVNSVDPMGLQDASGSDDGGEIIINGRRIKLINIYDRGDVNIWTGGFSIADLGTDPNEIVVTAKPKQGPPNIFDQIKDAFCSIPTGVFGAAADGHAVLGGSGLVGVTVDIPNGRIGLAGQLGVGVGLGASAGAFYGLTSPNAGIASANMHVTAGASTPLLGIGGSGTYNIIGTDAGSSSLSGGGIRGGTGSGYLDFGANIALQTPKIDFGCI